MTEMEDWRQLLARHGPALLLLARQYVPDLADAEDVLQEALVRYWRSRERAADPSAYLFGCVRGCALEWLRARQRRGRREQVVARSERVFFESQVLAEERRHAIEAALATLPSEQREVVVLRIWGGLSFANIGEVLGVSINTAMSRHRYALERLRRLLREEAIG